MKEKSDSARKAYTSQRNLCVNLLRKTKKNYFANLDVNSITDSRKFWQTVKPLFSNKLPHKETINLSENGQILNNDKKISVTFNNYFSNIIKKYLFLLPNHTMKRILITLLILHIWLLKNIKTTQAFLLLKIKCNL